VFYAVHNVNTYLKSSAWGVVSSGMKFVRSFVENGQVVQELKSEIKHRLAFFFFFTFKVRNAAILRLEEENNHPHLSIGIHDVRSHYKVF
jgi:hypothetical protein